MGKQQGTIQGRVQRRAKGCAPTIRKTDEIWSLQSQKTQETGLETICKNVIFIMGGTFRQEQHIKTGVERGS